MFLLASCQNKDKVLFEQYYIGGKQTYETNCANCHQKNGEGLGKLYPAIAKSDFLKNKANVICLIRNGSKKTDDSSAIFKKMPANPHLLPLDIAELTTYIYAEWGNEEHITPTDSVIKILKSCTTNDKERP